MYFKGNETIYSQIAEKIKKKIFSGEYPCGARLPAIRDLAVACQVNPNTVVRVYQQLSEEGLIYTDGTSGKFVTPDTALLSQKKREYLRGRALQFAREAKEAGVSEGEALTLAAAALADVFKAEERH